MSSLVPVFFSYTLFRTECQAAEVTANQEIAV